ncbi:uncharacterized protein DSM5745_03718 [Aspergillus mulundensis]|uniref:Uncharacterized protein n=1 Tax=Aspergillus mulundensis TaxID=1810919 RepID=A0A3D8SLB9_9EURO|nr:hypothetical protein DSM5745_03718 [Aspergillus mulundensis]RDW87076.1 hypothetical protein DSM5745_03718 [Aspergillus mulundensis]
MTNQASSGLSDTRRGAPVPFRWSDLFQSSRNRPSAPRTPPLPSCNSDGSEARSSQAHPPALREPPLHSHNHDGPEAQPNQNCPPAPGEHPLPSGNHGGGSAPRLWTELFYPRRDRDPADEQVSASTTPSRGLHSATPASNPSGALAPILISLAVDNTIKS